MKVPKILSNIFNPRASPKNRSWYRYSPYKFLFGSTSSGKSVNEITAMETIGF